MTPAPPDLEPLAQAYGWGSVLEVTTLHTGENKTYAVTTPDGAYVVRRYRSGGYTPAQVTAELEWLAALAGAVPVVPALRTRDGKLCAVREEGPTEIYAAFAYVAGDEPDPPTPRDFEVLGQLLRRLHDASAHILILATHAPPWPGYERPRYDVSTTVTGPLEHLLNTPFLDASYRWRCIGLAERLRERYGACDPKTNSFVHADLHFGNVLVSGDAWTLLDFDECGFGFHAFDLGTVRFHARARGQVEGWHAFLGGYGEPLPATTEIQLGTALKMFYTAGKLPLRLDIPELRGRVGSLIEQYLSMTERELADDLW